jgi:hypothetical protein
LAQETSCSVRRYNVDETILSISRSCHEGSDEGPWNHSFRFEHKLGPRLKVTALIDPAIDRAHAVLQKKCESFVRSAYENTSGKIISVFGGMLTKIWLCSVQEL